MSKLRRIKTHVNLAPSEDMLTLDDPRGLQEIDEESDCEILREDIETENLDRLVQRTMEQHPRYAASMDSSMAVEVHRLLPLSRREASDRHLWAWLGWVRYPDFVAWRWKPRSNGLRSPDRFVGNRVRQAFARLWWAAELTVAGDGNYELTERLLGLPGFQDVYEGIFGRAFCQYPPAIRAFIDVVGTAPEAIIRQTAKEFSYLLTTLVLESLSESELREILRHLVADVTRAATA